MSLSSPWRSSSAKDGTAADSKYTHKSYLTGSQKGTLYVYVRHLTTWNAAHHFYVLDLPGQSKWVVHEWLTDGVDSYATESFYGTKCLELGTFSLDQVYNAVHKASQGRTYSVRDYNCNMWTEKVASLLGLEIHVYYNCSEITYMDVRSCVIGSDEKPPLLGVAALTGVGLPVLGLYALGKLTYSAFHPIVRANRKNS